MLIVIVQFVTFCKFKQVEEEDDGSKFFKFFWVVWDLDRLKDYRISNKHQFWINIENIRTR